ncbi:MAG TPA: 50S ribosomal protein L25/general stress protein Ctc [Luteimonas sp.]
MSNHKITATSRTDEGKGASRRLRHAGKVPAIVYGGDAAPQSIQLDQEKTWVASQHEWFYSSIIDLEVDGKVETVLLRDMQRHPYRQLIMHLDFQRVNAKEAIRVSVPLHLVNADTSPAGKTAGVVLTQELNEVEVICLPGDLPESISVDLADMEIGATVHLSEVVLPKGVELATKIDEEHNPAVAVARHARVEVESEEGEGDVPAAKQDGEDE